MASLVLCQKEGFDPLDALTWTTDCVQGKCKECPEKTFYVPPQDRDTQVICALWGSKYDTTKMKVINNIHDYQFTIQELTTKFEEFLPKLAKHIFTAAHQLKACKECTECLDTHIIMTIEDYQQNIEVGHLEQTTTAHFSGNVTQVALYPVVIKYKLPGESKTRKGAIAFLSADRSHDYQQVELFEKLVFDFMKERHGIQPKVWWRWSDQCAAQFKSQFVNEKLRVAHHSMQMIEGAEVHFLYFETGEGKNESDTWGSIIKLAYNRAIQYNTETANRSVPEIANLIIGQLGDHSDKYDFMVIKVVEPFVRDENPHGIPVKGIQKMHHLSQTKDGNLIARDIACMECLKMEDLCELCKLIKPFHENITISEEEITNDDENNSEVEDRNEMEFDDDADYTDHEDMEEDDDEEYIAFAPGTVVWARVRSWYPGKICSVEEIPNNYKQLIPDHATGYLYVKRFEPFSDIKLVKMSNIDELGENKIDKVRASKSIDIMAAYSQALAAVAGDI